MAIALVASLILYALSVPHTKGSLARLPTAELVFESHLRVGMLRPLVQERHWVKAPLLSALRISAGAD